MTQKQHLKVCFENQDYLLSTINGTREDAIACYVGKTFNLGPKHDCDDYMLKCTHVEFI